MIGRTGWVLCVAAFGVLWQVSAVQAQSNLSRRDRGLVYQNYYQNRLNAQRVQKLQQKIDTDVRDFHETYTANQARNAVDPIERYLRDGRELEPEGRRLPPIYAGRRNYFMRLNYFNPPTRK